MCSVEDMEDFTALAASLAAGVGDVRGCLILSRDGLVLGAHPDGGEELVKPAWLSFAGLGEPERGFVQFGTEVWCYARRGAYAAFAVAGTTVRPGLVIDQMEQVLMSAEEARSKREGLRAPEPAVTPVAAPLSKPRTPLHPEPKPEEQPPVVIHAEVPAPTSTAASESSATPVGGPMPQPPAPSGESVVPMAEPLAAQGEPQAPEPDESAGESGDEVDRVLLAREFSQLLQEDSDAADG
jgi:hypothetical protein